MTTTTQASPILKWAGGKGRLLDTYQRFFPARFGTYFEPFLGGGAMFFRLQPKEAFLSDSNPDLINLYRVVREKLDPLVDALKVHRSNNCEEYFYQIRALVPELLCDVSRAARMLYLNKTCFNGLYRVNSKGQFNAPFGKYVDPPILQEDKLRAARQALQPAGVCLGKRPFDSIFPCSVDALAKAGDFVYFDPPYLPVSATSDFVGYTKESFGLAEHLRLRDLFVRLDQRGVHVLLSNSDCPAVRDLYAGHRMVDVAAARAINSKGSGRGKVNELLILSSTIKEVSQ